jgi:protein SCO1/2
VIRPVLVRARFAALAALAALAPPAAAEPPPPPVLQGVGVDDHVGARIPLDLLFTEVGARRVRLGDYFGDGKPALLVLAYARCKMLCSVVLAATVDAVRAMPLEVGRDYRLITVSIDPDEEAADAARRRADLVARIGHPDEPERWTYLVGGERPIHALADRLGFRYRRDPHSEQFAHPAVMFVIAPDGTIARYFQAIAPPPAALAAALRRAASGAPVVAESIAERILSCFRFDPAERAHRALIDRYLQIGGGLVVLAVASVVAGLLVWERRRRRRR